MFLVTVVGMVTAVLASFVVLVSRRPSKFHIERSIMVTAPPESAFALVNDLRAWQAWSPWKGSTLNRTYEGPTEGAGAICKWTGRSEGRMTIEQSHRPSRVGIKLEYFKPYTATNLATFTFATEPRGTKVTWAMDGRNGFVARAFFAITGRSLDKTVGCAFERGLVSLKGAVERPISRERRA
jgi:hypothetical protein